MTLTLYKEYFTLLCIFVHSTKYIHFFGTSVSVSFNLLLQLTMLTFVDSEIGIYYLTNFHIYNTETNILVINI